MVIFINFIVFLKFIDSGFVFRVLDLYVVVVGLNFVLNIDYILFSDYILFIVEEEKGIYLLCYCNKELYKSMKL